MNKIEHLGIAVKDLEASIKVYEALLNTACYKKIGGINNLKIKKSTISI